MKTERRYSKAHRFLNKHRLDFLLIFLLFLVLEVEVVTRAQDELERGVGRVFYFCPPVQTLDEKWTLIVTPLEDSTVVKLFKLKEDGCGSKVREETVNKLQLFVYNGTDEEAYKLIASKPVIAVICGGKTMDPVGWGRGATFYPSVEGIFSGKRFIITPISNYTGVYAVQDAEVSLEDSQGNLIDEWFVFANDTKVIQVSAAKPYLLTSSGNIMVFSWFNNATTQVPSIEGYMIGRNFFLKQSGTFIESRLYSGIILLFGYEDSLVKAVSLRDKKILFETTLRKGEYKYFYNLSLNVDDDLFISSSGLIGVWSVGCEGRNALRNIGDDILFVGGLHGEYVFHVPARGYLFAPDDVNINLNSEEKTLLRDQFIKLNMGDYFVKTDKPVIIEIIGDPGTHVSGGASPLNDWGNIILTYSYIEPSEPKSAEDFGSPNSILLVLIAVVLAIVVLIILRRKKR
jgi:hypothetical protein